MMRFGVSFVFEESYNPIFWNKLKICVPDSKMLLKTLADKVMMFFSTSAIFLDVNGPLVRSDEVKNESMISNMPASDMAD